MTTSTTKVLYYPRSDDDQTSGEHLTIRNVWFGFVGTASTHGIVPIYTSTGCFKKCTWLLAFLACTGGLTYQAYLITSLYLKFGTSPFITKQSARQLEFPAVSVCNTNPVRASALHLSPALQALVDSWQKKSRKKRDIPDNGYERFETSEDNLNGVHNHRKNRVKRSVNYYGNFSVTYTTMTQTTAKSQCAASCATCRLADMESAAEQQSILNLFECDGFQGSWIGLETDGSNFKWVQDSRAAWGAGAWTHWSAGQPSGSADCTAFKDNSGSIRKRTCSQSYGYVCEGDFTNPCDPNPCLNGGTCCVVDMSAKCSCPAGTNGTYCDGDSTTSTTTTTTTTTTTAPTTTTTTVPTTTTTTMTTTTIPPTTTTATTTTTTVPTTTTTVPTTTTTVPTTTTTTMTTTTIPTTTTTATTTTTMPGTTTTPITTSTTSTTTHSTTSTTPPTTTTRAPSSFPDKEPVREDFLQENEAMETLANLPEETKIKIGYELYQLVLSCEYENEKCNMSDFARFFDAVHGNCYVFNSGWLADGNSLPARRPGRSKGLKMTFNLGQNEYISGIAGSAGIVVVVHPQTRMPFPEDEGVFAAPGYLTSIGLNKVSVSRLSQPYSDCSEETQNQDINVYEEFYNVNYSASACYKTCYQKYVTQRCNCSDPQYPSKGQAFGGKNWTACSARNVTQDDCVYSVSLDYISDLLTCDCPIPCKETLYRYSISRGQWPSDVYADEFINLHASSLPGMTNYSSVRSFIDHNIVKIEVYFNEFNFQSIYEKPGYPILMYLVDWCSILGLWLGISLFSLTEFFELAADLVLVACCKIKRRASEKPATETETRDEERKDSKALLISRPNRRISTVSPQQKWAEPLSPSKYSELVKRHSTDINHSSALNGSSRNTLSGYSDSNNNFTSPQSLSSQTNTSNTYTYRKRRKYGTVVKPKTATTEGPGLGDIDEHSSEYRKISVASASDIKFDASDYGFQDY